MTNNELMKLTKKELVTLILEMTEKINILEEKEEMNQARKGGRPKIELSDEEKEKIIKLYQEEKWGYRKIAQEMKLSHSKIRQIILEMIQSMKEDQEG